MLMPANVVYPESDGEPLAENTRQLFWIIVLVENLVALFCDRVDVFVAGDQNWYPVEGDPSVVMAPDVYVVFGRPKGHRGSYKQWEEGGIPMTVVFEVLSPKNTALEMADKLAFYDDHGVEEYYLYDPDSNRLFVYLRRGEALVRVRQVNGFVSPRLGIRFDLSGAELVVRYPDGEPFRTVEELRGQREEAKQRADKAEQRADKAEHYAARLRELVQKSARQEATAEELAELNRLLESPPL
jgi:Uma2 family endonuclease